MGICNKFLNDLNRIQVENGLSPLSAFPPDRNWHRTSAKRNPGSIFLVALSGQRDSSPLKAASSTSTTANKSDGRYSLIAPTRNGLPPARNRLYGYSNELTDFLSARPRSRLELKKRAKQTKSVYVKLNSFHVTAVRAICLFSSLL